MAYYRAGVPGRLLRARGHHAAVSDSGQLTPAGTIALRLDAHDELGRVVAWEPDAVLLTGGWASATPLQMIEEARANGQRVLVDVDDWPWIPPGNPHYDQRLAGAKLAAITRSDALVCSTPAIADGLTSRGHVSVPTIVSRNVIEPELYEPARIANVRRRGWARARARKGGRVAYRGAVAYHDADVRLLRGWLDDLLVNFSSHAVHVGHDPSAPSFSGTACVSPSRLITRPLVTMAEYAYNLARVEVAVVPLSLEPFSLAKSNAAGLEWCAAGVPFVASDHPEYRELTGSVPRGIARDYGKWRRWVAALLDDAGRRAEHHALQRAELERFTFAHHVELDELPLERLLAELGVDRARGSAPGVSPGALQSGSEGHSSRCGQANPQPGDERK